jgi:hypothetical protein
VGQEWTWDRGALADHLPGVSDVRHAAIRPRPVAVHQLRNDLREYLGIVVLLRHKAIEQQDHVDANLIRGGRRRSLPPAGGQAWGIRSLMGVLVAAIMTARNGGWRTDARTPTMPLLAAGWLGRLPERSGARGT